MIAAELKLIADNKYACTECSKVYSWRWIRRHMVKEHGYHYWKDILYNPAENSEVEPK